MDVSHFWSRHETPEAPEQASLPRPRLGFYGVIDKHIDHKILNFISSQRPEWQIVLVGPLAKVDGASLLRARES